MKTSTLVIIAHAGPSVLRLYEEKCGPGVRVLPFIAAPVPGLEGGGLSMRYEAMANKYRSGRPRSPILRRIVKDQGDDLDLYDTTIFAWFSSGYALARHLVACEGDVACIHGWVGLDGGHAAMDSNQVPVAMDVNWAVKLAMRALDPQNVFAFGHTDVKTYGTTASTTTFINEVTRQVVAKIYGKTPGADAADMMAVLSDLRKGKPLVLPDEKMSEMFKPNGCLIIDPHDESDNDADEHKLALTGWGPALVARAVKAAEANKLRRLGQEATLGQRSLEAARRYLGERETTQNAGLFVQKCLAGTIRDGLKTRLTKGAWCAGFSGLCDSEVALKGEVLPPWRAAVWELVEDARDASCWMTREHAPRYKPFPGDRAVFKRGNQNPSKKGQEGHIALVDGYTTGDNNLFYTIGGNEDESVATRIRRLDDPDLVGFISYPGTPRVDKDTMDIAKDALALGMQRLANELPIGSDTPTDE